MLPVAGEELGDPAAYGDDRLFIHLRQGTGFDGHDAALDELRMAGHPVFTVQLDGGPADLGTLFVEWEVATALVGARLHINPFDQPNVQEAKDRTAAILEGFARDGKLPVEDPGSLSDVLAHAERGHSYICLQAFVAPTPARQALLARLQGRLRDASAVRYRGLRPALPPLHRPVPQGRSADRAVRATAGRRAGRRGDSRARVRLPHACATRRRSATPARSAAAAFPSRAFPWPPAGRRSSGRSSTSRKRGSPT